MMLIYIQVVANSNPDSSSTPFYYYLISSTPAQLPNGLAAARIRSAAELITSLCLLMCPPSACPTANFIPQIGHSCFLGLAGELGCASRTGLHRPASCGSLYGL